MYASTEPFGAMHAGNLDIAERCARLACSGATELVLLQFAAARAALGAVGDLAGDERAPAAARAPVAIGRAVELLRRSCAVAVDTQAGIAQALEERCTALAAELVAAMDRYARSAPPGATGLAGALRESVLTTQATWRMYAEAARRWNELGAAAAAPGRAETPCPGPVALETAAARAAGRSATRRRKPAAAPEPAAERKTPGRRTRH
jgi:hypothetical protein